MSHHDFGLKTENMKANRKDTQFDNTEMQECFIKLKELVPCLQQQEEKLSKVQVLQAVIDYILELELTLDFDPLEAARNLYKQQCSQERRPLTENSNNVVSTAAAAILSRLLLLPPPTASPQVHVSR